MRTSTEIMWSLHAPRVRLETLARFARLCYRILFEMTCYVISIKWCGCLLNRVRQTCSQCSLQASVQPNNPCARQQKCVFTCVSEVMHIFLHVCAYKIHCAVLRILHHFNRYQSLLLSFLVLVFNASSVLWPIKTMCLASHCHKCFF